MGFLPSLPNQSRATFYADNCLLQTALEVVARVSLVGNLLVNVPHNKRKNTQVAEEEDVATQRGQRWAEVEGSWRLLPELLPPILKPLPLRAKDPALSSVGTHTHLLETAGGGEEERRAPGARGCGADR